MFTGVWFGVGRGNAVLEAVKGGKKSVLVKTCCSSAVFSVPSIYQILTLSPGFTNLFSIVRLSEHLL